MGNAFRAAFSSGDTTQFYPSLDALLADYSVDLDGDSDARVERFALNPATGKVDLATGEEV